MEQNEDSSINKNAKILGTTIKWIIIPVVLTGLEHSRPRYLSAPDFVSRNSSQTQHPFMTDKACNGEAVNADLTDDNLDATIEDRSAPSSGAVFNNVFQSTTFLHAYDRPRDLPKKDPQEAKRHLKECRKIMQNVSKEQQRKISQANATGSDNSVNYWRLVVVPNWASVGKSSRVYNLWWHGVPSAVRSQVWQAVIGNPLSITRELFEACLAQSRQHIQRLERQRLASECADQAGHRWSSRFLSVGDFQANNNPLRRLLSLPPTSETHGHLQNEHCPSHPTSTMEGSNTKGLSSTAPSSMPTSAPMSPSSFRSLSSQSRDLKSDEDACLQVIGLDVSRTFPMLSMFQPDAPYCQSLHDLLAAYVFFQPSIGYLQGMSFIAAILLLVLGDVYVAFVAFATIMNRPSFYAFYSLDESEFSTYFTAFDILLENHLPRLHEHFAKCKLDSKLYLFDWLFTIFSRSLPLDVNLRIWDLFFRDGEPALLSAALGIMKMYEDQLLTYDFDRLASFLTGPMPDSMSPNDLVRSFSWKLQFTNDSKP
uniref:Rab-GAP TBC domain-containing protein n=1 Tax=Mesocestoides corti TaxID=53468 RepID=A0A5K3FP07_MESCO